MIKIWIGYDSRQVDAYRVCLESLQEHLAPPVEVLPLKLAQIASEGLYNRSTGHRDGNLWDDISDAPMSTEFAISRFFIPFLQDSGWAIFCDCDFLFRGDVAELIGLADKNYAIQVVKHNYVPRETTKMDGQKQTQYAKKNWSSLMLWNLEHPAHKRLTLEMLNTRPGRDLHGFCWLGSDEIGGLPLEWNWLEGISNPNVIPKAVHYTRGLPNVAGYEDSAYADEWRALL